MNKTCSSILHDSYITCVVYINNIILQSSIQITLIIYYSSKNFPTCLFTKLVYRYCQRNTFNITLLKYNFKNKELARYFALIQKGIKPRFG